MIRLSDARSYLTRWFKQHLRTLRLIVAAISIGLLIFIVRLSLFGDRITWQVTLIFAPFSEDALKLGITLILLVVTFPRMKSVGGAGRQDLIRRTRIALVLLPLVTGCIFALVEPPAVTGFLFHMASTGLAFAVCLYAWRRWSPLTGLLLGLVVGALVHFFMNTAYYWPLSPRGLYQFAAALVLLIAAVLALWCTSRQEPASDVASEFFPRAAWNGCG